MKAVLAKKIDDHLHIGLNRPEKLGALNENMVLELKALLKASTASEVVLYGQSERAFCAGGDVASVVNRAGGEPTFFAHEYAADLALWSFKGRLTTIGHGIVMGGGMGLFAPGHCRVVSETTVSAMPEITIGFFPDVGAHYFLRKFMGDEHARFVALTGARLNGKEMLESGLATHFIENRFLKTMLDKKIGIDEIDRLSLECRVQTHFRSLENRLLIYNKEINAFNLLPTIEEKDEYARKYMQENGSGWFYQTMEIYLAGSPTSKYLTQKLFERSPSKSPKEALDLDLKIAHWLDRGPDFKEGVRALLIDKDKNPSWQILTNDLKKEIDHLLK